MGIPPSSPGPLMFTGSLSFCKVAPGGGRGRGRDLASALSDTSQHLTRPDAEPSGVQGDRTVPRTQEGFLEEEGHQEPTLRHATRPRGGTPPALGLLPTPQPFLVTCLNVLLAEPLRELAQGRGLWSSRPGLPTLSDTRSCCLRGPVSKGQLIFTEYRAGAGDHSASSEVQGAEQTESCGAPRAG